LDIARLAHLLGEIPQAVTGDLQPVRPVERVVPPCAVVELRGHRVPVLAVVGLGDAQVLLPLQQVDDAVGQQCGVLLGAGAPRGLGGVRLSEGGGARKRSGVGGADGVEHGDLLVEPGYPARFLGYPARAPVSGDSAARADDHRSPHACTPTLRGASWTAKKRHKPTRPWRASGASGSLRDLTIE